MVGARRPPADEARGLIRDLRGVVGAKLVAYLGEARDTSTVCGWVEGTHELPSRQVLGRFVVALAAARELGVREEPVGVQAWFLGLNPTLGDRAPAQVLREDDSDQGRGAVERAAREFSAHGFNS